MALRNLNSPAVSSRHRFLSFAFVNDALNFGGTFARAKAEKAASSDTAGEFDRKCSTGSVSDLSLPIYRHFEARGRSRSPYCTNSPAVSLAAALQRLRRFRGLSLHSLDFYLHTPQLNGLCDGMPRAIPEMSADRNLHTRRKEPTVEPDISTQ